MAGVDDIIGKGGKQKVTDDVKNHDQVIEEFVVHGCRSPKRGAQPSKVHFMRSRSGCDGGCCAGPPGLDERKPMPRTMGAWMPNVTEVENRFRVFEVDEEDDEDDEEEDEDDDEEDDFGDFGEAQVLPAPPLYTASMDIDAAENANNTADTDDDFGDFGEAQAQAVRLLRHVDACPEA